MAASGLELGSALAAAFTGAHGGASASVLATVSPLKKTAAATGFAARSLMLTEAAASLARTDTLKQCSRSWD
jgi:hypothetical protein